MSIDSLSGLLRACRTWIRRCDDHPELQEAREGFEEIAEQARTRLWIQPREIGAFEELVKACEAWIEGQEDPGVKSGAMLLAQAKSQASVVDYPTLHARLGECEEWLKELDLDEAEVAFEALCYWVNEVGERVEKRRREFAASWEPPEEGTYQEPPIPYDPSWGSSSPTDPEYDEQPDDMESFTPMQAPERPDDEEIGF